MGLYIVASYRAAPLLTRVASLCLIAALYIGWYSFCTTSWGQVFPRDDDAYYLGYGVWRIGDNQFQASNASLTPLPSIQHTDGWLLEWYGAFQAMSTLGFISVNVAYVLVVLVIYVACCKNNADVLFWNALNNFFGCACWLTAVLLFGLKFADTFGVVPQFQPPQLGYSYYLAVVTCGLQLLAGVLLTISYRTAHTTSVDTVTEP